MKPEAVLRPGQRLGPFELDRKLAVGGMAEVWRAVETLPSGGQHVRALKVVLQQHLSRDAFRDMFWDEVGIVRRLDHPHVVRVFDGLEVEGLLVQVMELVEGVDVRRLAMALGAAPMPTAFALLIARDAAAGLSHAHEHRGPDGALAGIVHRDVSPHNLMVQPSGITKVLDFGIAFAVERQARTTTGTVKGKLAYMAPEQALGESVDARSDIFSLGIVLWELLAGRVLFAAPTDKETLRRVAAAEVPALPTRNQSVSTPLELLVHGMLALEPQGRPRSMRQVQRRLEQMLQQVDGPVDAVRDRLARWLQPHLEVGVAADRRTTALLDL